MTWVLVVLAAFLLDRTLGDPAWLPHPVVLIGKGIDGLEIALRPRFPASPQGEMKAGLTMTLLVLLLVGAAVWCILALAWAVHPALYWLAQIWLGFQALAAQGLRQASLLVYRYLAHTDLHGAREAVGRIVGRDTAHLDEAGVTRAAVETVAENASDGVIAPLFYFVLGGAVLAWLYKAINTMDSMVGYKNERYIHFGRCAARLDDAANFIPARLTALLLLAAARWRGWDWRNGWRIFRRDRYNHGSPNSAQPEAACAGILGIRLGGDTSYGGRMVKKPGIGDARRVIQPEDIVRANALLSTASWLAVCAAAVVFVLYAFWGVAA